MRSDAGTRARGAGPTDRPRERPNRPVPVPANNISPYLQIPTQLRPLLPAYAELCFANGMQTKAINKTYLDVLTQLALTELSQHVRVFQSDVTVIHFLIKRRSHAGIVRRTYTEAYSSVFSSLKIRIKPLLLFADIFPVYERTRLDCPRINLSFQYVT